MLRALTTSHLITKNHSQNIHTYPPIYIYIYIYIYKVGDCSRGQPFSIATPPRCRDIYIYIYIYILGTSLTIQWDTMLIILGKRCIKLNFSWHHFCQLRTDTLEVCMKSGDLSILAENFDPCLITGIEERVIGSKYNWFGFFLRWHGNLHGLFNSKFILKNSGSTINPKLRGTKRSITFRRVLIRKVPK